MQRPDRRLSLIVDLNQAFTLRSVMKDLSIVHDVAVKVSAMRIALRIAGNRVVCLTNSIIPRELSSSGLCFCTSYHARASSTRLSMPYISLTDETMCLNCENMACYFHQSDFPETGSRNPCTGYRWCGNYFSMEPPTFGRWTWLAHHRGIVKSMPRFFCQGFHLRDEIF
ncbi:hypothetical protein LSH36_555g03016 [Paralvinella palmiformis]|uniref:Uncharacterized protein n=1 Tax=Paralvinella palmiformis TaxID=53620 RepID=A0AAD9MVX2_9ANNE|nr:hypothetical protein LSH36_555g03016 [Paralvinella palmiformis]